MTASARLRRVLAAEDDDRRSFEALFEQHHRAVLAYCLRRTRNPVDAEDATAETFAIAWRRRLDLPEATLPWLYGTARRVLANQRRGAGRWAGLLERLRLQPPHRVLESAAGAGAGAAIDALESLRLDDQELLRLVAWEDLGHAEIAAILGISANAVAIRVHRARRRYADAYRALKAGPAKENGPGRTPVVVTGGRPGRWRPAKRS